MTNPKPKRRWYQFSLRTLMLFMVVCAVVSAWFGKKLDETRREQVMVAEIEKLGGRVGYMDTMVPRWVAAPFRRASFVGFCYGNVTDDEVVHLERLTNLKRLSLNGAQVTDAGLVHLEGLPNLEVLGLAYTQVTDAGLEHLKGLSNLKRLYLNGTKVTDEGVEKLQQALPDCVIEH